VVEDINGQAKEVAGEMTGRGVLERDGEAQQSKATAERDAVKRETQSEASRAEAEAQDAKQRASHKGGRR
jgi:uncharacterized protein YjbJ (UPF0337 family)